MTPLQIQSRPLNRVAIRERFVEARTRTRALFDMLDDAAYYERPIALRNPVVFYEGHIPAFAINTLIKKALGRPGIDDHLETIFARGIDPESEATAKARGNPAWPTRERVREYVDAADRLVLDAIEHEDLVRPGHPLLEHAQALWTILEHEEMHQETLAYIWHQLPPHRKHAPSGYRARTSQFASTPAISQVHIPAGVATLGTTPDDDTFAWDNEQREHRVEVDGFSIDVLNVTNGAFLEFVSAGGYNNADVWRPEDFAWIQGDGITHPHFWVRERSCWMLRAMFETLPLPLDWPVYVTWAEANAYARWAGRRLPTEAEYHRAAFGSPEGERQFPWGDAFGCPSGNVDFRRWDPEPVGLHADTASAYGVHDLVGNGWEWTRTVFGPFPGFTPLPSYPEYSADFFDDAHFVMKGASPVTSRFLVRRGFRNWFRPRYPYVHATFRCVGDAR
ncbi:MAG: SUMF1/EgtB/PvdO family nonheme iron enzyme [Vicinamibacterales bacterium]